ncbi:MAG: PAC2 family protein [Candidatus Micrarchaeota archaeon]
MALELRIVDKPKLKNPVIIEGFPGIGMIGTITASFLAEKLQMKLIGYFSSPHFPPIAAIHDYVPVSPARIYCSEKDDLIVVFSEMVIPSQLVVPLSEKIIDLAEKYNAKAIYSFAGIATPSPDEKIYAIASTKKLVEEMKKQNFELVKEGATQGVSGVLIAQCAAQKFPAINFMAQTSSPLDPRAAAKLIDRIMPYIGVKVDTKPLVAEAEKVEVKLKEAMDKMKQMHTDYSKMQGTSQSMYG